MLRLYTHKDLLIPNNRSVVHPILFDLHYFESTNPIVNAHYQLVDAPNEADAFVYPINFLARTGATYKKSFEELYRLALERDKKLMVYTGGDYGKSFKNATIITWRNAGFKSTNDKNTVIIPAFITDPITREGMGFFTHEYQVKPSISFTGFATSSSTEKIRVILATLKGNVSRLVGSNSSDKQKVYNAACKRHHYLKQMEKSNDIETSFIYRNAYRAGAITENQRVQTTTEFFQNLNNAPYTFCLRGAGNFSVRFYESLAYGRIPVLVDTDVQLPLENVIDWDKHICRVSEGKDIAIQLMKFHKKHNASSFVKLQKSNRALYLNTLVRHHYFCNLHDQLKKII